MTPASSGVILYGPPASGKDTITKALVDLDRRYAHYRRMKVGSGRTAGYQPTNSAELVNLRKSGRVIWENERYGATYVVERDSLAKLAATSIPVLHLGQLDAIPVVHESMPNVRWVDVYIWCPRDVAVQRLRERQTGDLAARICVWDETVPFLDACLALNTATVSPADAARAIHNVCVRQTGRCHVPPPPG